MVCKLSCCPNTGQKVWYSEYFKSSYLEDPNTGPFCQNQMVQQITLLSLYAWKIQSVDSGIQKSSNLIPTESMFCDEKRNFEWNSQKSTFVLNCYYLWPAENCPSLLFSYFVLLVWLTWSYNVTKQDWLRTISGIVQGYCFHAWINGLQWFLDWNGVLNR